MTTETRYVRMVRYSTSLSPRAAWTQARQDCRHLRTECSLPFRSDTAGAAVDLREVVSPPIGFAKHQCVTRRVRRDRSSQTVCSATNHGIEAENTTESVQSSHYPDDRADGGPGRGEQQEQRASPRVVESDRSERCCPRGTTVSAAAPPHAAPRAIRATPAMRAIISP
jgi:hypothetical protein